MNYQSSQVQCAICSKEMLRKSIYVHMRDVHKVISKNSSSDMDERINNMLMSVGK